MAQLKDTVIDGTLTVSESDVYLDNAKIIYAKNPDGENRSLVQTNASGEYFFGWGGYKNSEGASYVDGNAVNIRSKGGIYVTDPDAGLSARAYGQNKILWTGDTDTTLGGYYMTAGHKISLSESVSAQPNGIILVWSMYTSGACENAAFNYTFVPKQHVTSYAGCGVSCYLTGYQSSAGGMNVVGFKYVYVNNASIVGHDSNIFTGTSNGITLTSNRFVLRQVIGV